MKRLFFVTLVLFLLTSCYLFSTDVDVVFINSTNSTIQSIKWSYAGNTAAIVAALGNAEPYANKTDYAAKICYDLVLNGYDDWFLPSKDELNLMYEQKGVIGGFAGAYYWSSSEYFLNYAWSQYFYNGLKLENGSFRGINPTDGKIFLWFYITN